MKKWGFCQLLLNASYVTNLPPPFPSPLHKGLSDGFRALKFVARNYLRECNIVTPLYTTEKGTKMFLKHLLFVIMNLDANSWFYTGFNFDFLWVNFVK